MLKRLQCALFIAVVLGGALVGWGRASAQPSTAFQINPAHNGTTFFPNGLKLPLQQVWSRKFPVDMGYINDVGYPVIVGNKVFMTVTDMRSNFVTGNLVLALSLQDGRQLWGRGFPGTHYWTALAYDNGRLFVVTGEGWLHTLDPETGNVLWRTNLHDINSWMFTSPPTAQDGKVYVAASGFAGTLFALDQITGKVVWKKRLADGNGASPTVLSGTVFVGGCGGAYAFVSSTGALRWQQKGACSSGLGHTAPYYSGRVYTNGFVPFKMYSFDISNGAPIQAFQNIVKPPAFWNGIGYFVTYSSGLVAWSTKTNSVLWQQFVGTEPALPPIVISGRVVVISHGAELFVLEGQSGKILQQLPLGGHVTPNAETDGLIRKGLAAGEGMVIAITDDSIVALRPAP